MRRALAGLATLIAAVISLAPGASAASISGTPLQIIDAGDGTLDAGFADTTELGGQGSGLNVLVTSGTPTVYGFLGTSPFTTVTAPVLTGDGSSATPWTLTSSYQADATGAHDITVTQTTTYIDGNQFFDVSYSIHNNTGGTLSVVPKLIGDLLPGGVTNGLGLGSPSIGAVNWDTATFDSVSGTLPTAVQEGDLATLKAKVQSVDSGGDFTNNSVDALLTDASAGVQWGSFAAPQAIDSGASHAFSARFQFVRLLHLSTTSDSLLQGANENIHAMFRHLDGTADANDTLIRYSISGANPHAETGANSDPNGGVDISWTGTNPGVDTMTIYDDLNDNGVRDPLSEPQQIATVTWASTVTLSPSSDTKIQGNQESVTANILNSNGSPKIGYGQVRYSLSLGGANPQAETSAGPTSGTGDTTINWTGTHAGNDTLTVYDDLNNDQTFEPGEPQAVATVHWATPPQPPDSATSMANAISAQTGLVTGASWLISPPGAQDHGPADKVWSGGLSGFPTDGTTFGVLTSGDANLPNQAQGTLASVTNSPTTNPQRGANDVSVLKVDVQVPSSANCLTFDFKFLSEEFPQFVGSPFNDAFLAELDTSDWSVAGQTLTAPHNFAFDAQGHPVSINSSGVSQMNAANAADTVYGGATQVLQAATPVSAGAHSVYFTIFDASDSVLDSAAFVDDLKAVNAASGACVSGVSTPHAIPPPTTTPPTTTPPLSTPPAQGPPGPPIEGRTVNAFLDSGTVLVKLPPGFAKSKDAGTRAAAAGFIPLSKLGRQVPVGSTLDTTHGQVHLFSATNKTGGTQDGHFGKGLFIVQQNGTNPLTSLVMTGGNLNSCSKLPRGGSAKAVAAARRGRSLFSNVHGHFRAVGRNSSATVRGTEFLVKDTCNGTLTTVRRGAVTVRDFSLKKNVTVKAGHKYLALPPKRVHK